MQTFDPKKKTLIVIVGPTAVGKTDLCVRLAKRLETEVISADSRQFYREMAIGTAKPSAEEMQGVPHYFVDSHSIQEDYNVGQFEQEALQVIMERFQEKDTLILTGGSGLYIKAVCEGIDEMPAIPEEVRAKWNALKEEKGIGYLQSYLAKVDPDYFAEVDQQNPQRLIRAIEVYEVTGKPFSTFRKQQDEGKERPFKILKIGLNRPREVLYERINKRMDIMLHEGLLEEAKALYPYRAHNALQTVGYREIFDFIEGKTNWEETVELLKRNSRRYAKRQLTWFRKDEAIAWFHPEEEEAIWKHIQENISH